MEATRNCRFLFKGYRKIRSTNFASSQNEKNVLWRVMRVVSVKLQESKAIHRKRIDSRELDQESHLINGGINHIQQNEQITAGTDITENVQNQTSNLHISARLKIYVKISSKSKSIVVEAKGHHIIHEIKSRIHSFEGIDSNEYCLFYNGKRVEDYRSLASLGIKTESTLHLIFHPKTFLPISVRTPSGKILKFEVNVLYTVRDVKTIVESFVGCPVSDCTMIYVQNELDEAKSLASYGIEENSVLELQSSWIQIFVKTWSGKTVTLFVRKSSTVREVKEKLFCKTGMPIILQRIAFSGKRLEDDRTLASYDVSKDSTLHMVL